MEQDVTPVTTQIGVVVTQGLQTLLDPVALQNIQNSLLAAVDSLQFVLSKGSTNVTSVTNLSPVPLTNPQQGLLDFAATTIFDVMSLLRRQYSTRRNVCGCVYRLLPGC